MAVEIPVFCVERHSYVRGVARSFSLADLQWLVERPQRVERKQQADLFIAAVLKEPYICAKNVTHVTMIGLDFDDGVTFPQVTEWFRRCRFAWLAHTTFSHRPEHHKLRVLIPFAEPCPVVLWRSLWNWFAGQVKGYADAQCKDVTRRYFVPCTREPEQYAWATGALENIFDWRLLNLAPEPRTRADFSAPPTEIAGRSYARLAGLNAEMTSAAGSRHDALLKGALKGHWMEAQGLIAAHNWQAEVRAAGDTLGKDQREVERLIRWVERRAAIRRAAADDIGF